MDKINAGMFLKVVETGSFSKAAEELHYTQAGISYAINAMEEELGLRLFVREYGGVKLSSDGEAVLPAIKAIDAGERLLREKVAELQNLESGSVRIVAINSMALNRLPEIIIKFKEKYPAVDVKLEISESQKEAEEMLQRHEADIGFFQKKPSEDIVSSQVMREPIVACFGPGHPALKRKRFPRTEIGKYPYIKMPEDEDMEMEGLFDGVEELNVAFETDKDYIALAMISGGLGFGIFPKLMLEGIPYEIETREFNKPLYRTIWMGEASEDSMGRAAKSFLEHIRNSLSFYK